MSTVNLHTVESANAWVAEMNDRIHDLVSGILDGYERKAHVALGYRDSIAGYSKMADERLWASGLSLKKPQRDRILDYFKPYYERGEIDLAIVAKIAGTSKATVSRHFNPDTVVTERGVVQRQDGTAGAGAPSVASETPRETVTATVVTDDYEIARAAILRMHHNGDSRLALLAMDIMDLVREPAAIAA